MTLERSFKDFCSIAGMCHLNNLSILNQDITKKPKVLCGGLQTSKLQNSAMIVECPVDTQKPLMNYTAVYYNSEESCSMEALQKLQVTLTRNSFTKELLLQTKNNKIYLLPHIVKPVRT